MMQDYEYPDGDDQRDGLGQLESRLAIGDQREDVEWGILYGIPQGLLADMNDLEPGEDLMAFDPRDIEASRIPESAFSIVAQDLLEKLQEQRGDEIDWDVDFGEIRRVATLRGEWVKPADTDWHLHKYAFDLDVDPDVTVPGGGQ